MICYFNIFIGMPFDVFIKTRRNPTLPCFEFSPFLFPPFRNAKTLDLNPHLLCFVHLYKEWNNDWTVQPIATLQACKRHNKLVAFLVRVIILHTLVLRSSLESIHFIRLLRRIVNFTLFFSNHRIQTLQIPPGIKSIAPPLDLINSTKDLNLVFSFCWIFLNQTKNLF